MTEIPKAWVQLPQKPYELSVAPEWYKSYIDTNQNHGTVWMKTIIEANFPAIKNLMVFHDSKSDIWGKMIVRFLYNDRPIEFPVSYQQKLNTLTPQEFQDLAPHIQSMDLDTRWLFNVILGYVKKLEINKKWVTNRAHAQLEDLANETQAA